ncbi:MAG: peptide chain release factor N(5)-glutamine methyltransferase [Luteitalea sp.]|nr:peptide chain release factor N(5)-glutamine methyltransferase [Luteitalea sp.]
MRSARITSRRSSKTPPRFPDLRGHVLAARARLERAGLTPDEAALDARLLAQHVLGWDAARFFTAETEPAPDHFVERYAPLVDRRLEREPLPYITGTREFWDLTFEVSPAVLIPRPETELLVEVALERWPPAAPLRVADVCTGSGCVAVALARERPGSVILATDLSADALEIARRNAARHHVGEQVRFLRTDLLEGAPGPFDLIVSNPPYVPEGDRFSLQREVIDYEPALALFAGEDGLDAIVRLTDQAVSRLTPDGLLAFEFGAGQEPRIQELMARTDRLRLVEVKNDLQGIPRTAVVIRT